MLADLLKALAEAGSPREKEKAYRNLEHAGVDRLTADILVKELKKEAVADGR